MGKQLATLGLPSTCKKQTCLKNKHSHICKFEDYDWKLVLGQIIKMDKNAIKSE